jgi:hypothetical protein
VGVLLAPKSFYFFVEKRKENSIMINEIVHDVALLQEDMNYFAVD